MRRTNRRRVRVPSTLPDDVRDVLGHYLNDPTLTDRDDQRVRTLRAFRPVRRYASGFVTVDADGLDTVRDLLVDDASHDHDCTNVRRWFRRRRQDPCGTCARCSKDALVRRIDFWIEMSAAGDHHSTGDDVERDWADVRLRVA